MPKIYLQYLLNRLLGEGQLTDKEIVDAVVKRMAKRKSRVLRWKKKRNKRYNDSGGHWK